MRTKTGIVTSTKMQKTIVVTVDTYKTHPKYKKRYKSSVKFYAHDENGLAKPPKENTDYTTCKTW